MKRNLKLKQEVVEFAKKLAPQPRRVLKHALEKLRMGEGDIAPLQGELSGYHRLRVNQTRVIFVHRRFGCPSDDLLTWVPHPHAPDCHHVQQQSY